MHKYLYFTILRNICNFYLKSLILNNKLINLNLFKFGLNFYLKSLILNNKLINKKIFIILYNECFNIWFKWLDRTTIY